MTGSIIFDAKMDATLQPCPVFLPTVPEVLAKGRFPVQNRQQDLPIAYLPVRKR